MNKNNYNCPHFNVMTQIKQFEHIGKNIYVVLLNDDRIFVLKEWGFWGHVGTCTLMKGLYSNREYDLSEKQITACIEAKSKLLNR